MESKATTFSMSSVSTAIPSADRVKNLSKEMFSEDKTVIITKCLTIPCPRFYTDTISETVRIICKDIDHVDSIF